LGVVQEILVKDIVMPIVHLIGVVSIIMVLILSVMRNNPVLVVELMEYVKMIVHVWNHVKMNAPAVLIVEEEQTARIMEHVEVFQVRVTRLEANQ
jgi:hypothetical protein